MTRFRTRKTGALLAYLALYPNRPHSRDHLVELFWPESAPEAGRTNLRVALASLREALGAYSALLAVDRCSAWMDRARFTSDVADFKEALRAARASAAERPVHLARAMACWGGELLPGYIDEWVLRERAQLTEALLGAMEALIALRERAGDLEVAIEIARRAVEADPLREESHGHLIRLLHASGRPLAALRQYRELERILRRELHLSPGSETRALLPGRLTGLQSVPELNLHSASATSKLPRPLTPFFGREPEMAQLVGWLTETNGPRLITLTGPGGSGKTRLAIEVAARLAEAQRTPFPGIWFVPLAGVTDATRLPDALRDALGLPHLSGADPLEQIATALEGDPFAPASGRTLLILDNLEHLVEGGAPIARALLEGVSTLVCMVTSRCRLGIKGEQEFSVGPLPVPEAPAALRSAVRSSERNEGAGHPRAARVVPARRSAAADHAERGTPSAERLLAFPSVQLFLDRARAVRPEFHLTADNAAAVATLCERLEGLPLSILLAAARVSVLTPAQMLAHLDRRFDLLIAPRQEESARHRSLRAALHWSYELLPPELKRFFAHLSVFRGGWTLEAAEAICAPEGAADRDPCAILGTSRVLDSLEQLRHSSLILAEDGSQGREMRFHMLETLREFAAEHLPTSERAGLEERHARYYLALTEAHERGENGPDRATWLDRLRHDYENLCRALEWGLRAPDDGEFALRLSGSLGWYWCFRGPMREGRERLAAALARVRSGALTAPRAKALMSAGALAWQEEEPAAALPLLEESVALWQVLGDREAEAHARTCLAWTARNLGEPERARAEAEASIALYREIGNCTRIVGALNCLAMLLGEAGECDPALALLAESRDLARASGDPYLLSVALACTGAVLGYRGDDAWAYHEESAALSRAIHPLNALIQHLYLAEIAERQGRNAVAAQKLAEGMAIADEIGHAHWREVFRGRVQRLDQRGEKGIATNPASCVEAGDLTDDQWDRIRPLLPPPCGRGRPRADERRALDGIRHVLRSGCRWRDLPARYGSPATCWRRWQAWKASGAWERLLPLLETPAGANRDDGPF